MDTIIPKIDEPLRDPGICRGPDNIYYLTGTTPIEGKDGRPDFNNCRGARLWSSEDLRSWKDHGLVWDLWEDVGTDMGRALASWQTELYPVPGLPPSERARGFTAPRLTFAANRFWLSYSMSGQGAGVMLSRSTDAAGALHRRAADRRSRRQTAGVRSKNSADVQTQEITAFLVRCTERSRPKSPRLAARTTMAVAPSGPVVWR